MEINRTNHLGMEVYGNVDQVFRAFHERSRLIKNGDVSLQEALILRKSAENTVLMPGGGQMNTVLCGQSKAMHEEGFKEGIDTIEANSSGAAVAACLIAGHDKSNIFYERNILNNYVSWWRNPILDVRTVVKELETPTSLSHEVFADPYATRLHVHLTELLSGLSSSFRADDVKRPISLILASMLMPYFTGLPSPNIKITCNGVSSRYVDGWISEPTLIKPARERGAKNILLTTANPLDHRLSSSDEFAEFCWEQVSKGELPGFVAAVVDFPGRFNRGMEELKGYLDGSNPLPEGVHLTVIAPTKMPIGPMCMDMKLLYETQVEAREHKRALINSFL
jgi:hypothetical protein